MKETTCQCGSNDFERVVVERSNAVPYETEFVACVHCRVMYHVPEVVPSEPPDRPAAGQDAMRGSEDWTDQYRRLMKGRL